MITRQQILEMLGDSEGPLLERKPARVNLREIRQTVCAFANSLTEGQEAVLFIGMRDDGGIEGCQDTDSLQKSIRDACEKHCYPPIAYRVEVLHERQNVVAVVIPASDRRPHFSGPAYVRRGSESVAASPEMFDELIWSHNDKAAVLLSYKRQHQKVQVVGVGHRLGSTKRLGDSHYVEAAECLVTDCNAQFVKLQKIASQVNFSEPLEHINISYDEEKWCPKIVVTGY